MHKLSLGAGACAPCATTLPPSRRGTVLAAMGLQLQAFVSALLLSPVYRDLGALHGHMLRDIGLADSRRD